MNAVRLLFIALALLPAAIGRSMADTALAVGDCNTINQNITIGENSTLVVENDCIADKPENSYRIRYIWLDSKNTSFVFSNIYDDALKRLLGSSPRLLKAGAYDIVSDIIRKFGEKMTTNGSFFGSQFSNNLLGTDSEISSSSEQPFSSFNIKDIRKLRIYAGEENIIWPDLSSTEIVVKTDRWPDKYSLTYRDTDDAKATSLKFSGDEEKTSHNNVFLCTLLYKVLSRADIDNYWDSVDMLESKVGDIINDDPYYVNEVFGSKEFREAALEHPSIEALKYFSQHNWPDDFIIAVGNFTESGCGRGKFGFYAVPRTLFVHFAVIESTARVLPIAELTLEKDSRFELRTETKFESQEHIPLNDLTLKRGETMLVPLGIELRYDNEEEPVSAIHDNSDAHSWFDAIANANVTTFKFYDNFGDSIKKNKLINKSKAEFKPPSFLSVTHKYLFGNRFGLKAININGTDYPVRTSPASAYVMNGSFEEGSCPFLLFRSANLELARHGRILVGADSSLLERHERINVPKDARSIVIQEREPEISYLARIYLTDRRTKKRVILAKNLMLRPRRQVEFKIPIGFRRSSILTIRGHYVSLTR